MDNFNFYNPVKILFGKGKVNQIAENIPSGSRILITYGGGSIMKNGVYQQVKEALNDFNVWEFGGIEPNPTYETCIKALEVINQHKINFLLAVGGGSVIDGTKFIAAAHFYKGNDPWEILLGKAEIKEALPIGTVLTLPATGTEMNGNSVISRKSVNEKLAFGSALVMPVFSVLDPEHTFSLPKRQVINGIVDAFVHVMEQYLTYPNNTPVQDRMAEGILLTLIEEGRIAVATSSPNYENRANIMWAATMALNGIINVGVKQDWATHQIGHELTAFHGLDHAVTLAIVLPGLLRIKMNQRAEKLLQYGERIWQVSKGTKEQRLLETIEKTDAFFRELGVLTTLTEHQIDSTTIDKIVNRFQLRGYKTIGSQADISLEEVRQILTLRL